MDACHFVMDGSHQLCHQRLLKSRLRPLDPFAFGTVTSLRFFSFLPGLFLSVHFIIWDVFCLLVRLSSRLRATVGRQTNATSCQNFESVARRKGPAVFRVRSTWSRARRWKAVFFLPRPPSDADECLLAELRARKRKTLPCPRRPTLQHTSPCALAKYLQKSHCGCGGDAFSNFSFSCRRSKSEILQ